MTKKENNEPGKAMIDRRLFLKSTALGLAGTALPLKKARASIWNSFFQEHFSEMDDGEIKKVLERLEQENQKKYGRNIDIRADKPIEGVKFAYALDLSRCVGCRKCVYACVSENNQSRNPQIHWISVLKFKKDDKWIDLENADRYYDPNLVPEDDSFYMPVQCQQCEDPPCVKVCPTQATWKEKDGIIVVDYNWCIGCRYCMAACPYGARHFNWSKPGIPKDEINPNTHYLGNRPRYKGVVEKCTFCVQRTRVGKYPACVEVCPVGARKFGDLLDPDSEIRYIIENKRVFRLKEDLNTIPKFYYFFAT
ncbi:MAG: 4Fe-4S dicluster domain-containing protein [Desulfobacula sp.]|nr:4Fe-4S dicluster domain-containing protein [Desulfobacula sp.]